MTDLAAIEDTNNIRTILLHHLGYPQEVDGVRLGLLDEEYFNRLERDLLRYCTRLRCQPRTDKHVDTQGYQVPAHQLIGEGRHAR